MNDLYKPSKTSDMEKVIPVLEAIRHAAEEGGARYVMIIHPDQTQTDEHLRQEITRTFPVAEKEYDFDRPQKILTSYCAAKGILCLNLLPEFRAKAKLGALYGIRDGHYNLNGNELAAAMISQFLLDKQLIRSTISGSKARL